MILLFGGILGKMELEKLKFLSVLNLSPAEAVRIVQVSGSPVFFIFGAESVVSHTEGLLSSTRRVRTGLEENPLAHQMLTEGTCFPKPDSCTEK